MICVGCLQILAVSLACIRHLAESHARVAREITAVAKRVRCTHTGRETCACVCTWQLPRVQGCSMSPELAASTATKPAQWYGPVSAARALPAPKPVVATTRAIRDVSQHTQSWTYLFGACAHACSIVLVGNADAKRPRRS